MHFLFTPFLGYGIQQLGEAVGFPHGTHHTETLGFTLCGVIDEHRVAQVEACLSGIIKDGQHLLFELARELVFDELPGLILHLVVLGEATLLTHLSHVEAQHDVGLLRNQLSEAGNGLAA